MDRLGEERVVGTVPKAEEVTGGLGEVKTRRADIVDETLTPEVQSASVREEGLPSGTAGFDQFKRGLSNIKEYVLNQIGDALSINESGTSNAMTAIIDYLDEVTKGDPELSSLIAQKQRAEDSGANLDFTGTINALGTGNLSTESDIESYLSSVSDDKPKKDTVEDTIERQRETAREAARKAATKRRKDERREEREKVAKYNAKLATQRKASAGQIAKRISKDVKGKGAKALGVRPIKGKSSGPFAKGGLAGRK